MGEETKQEEVKPAEKPVEEKKEEEKKDEEKPEEKKEEEAKPPSPVVLFVDLHCVGCARKIEKSLMRYRGVEGVVINMEQNQITVKGVVDPQALCTTIQKKTKRRATILSPLPAADDEATPKLVTSQVSGLVTVELNVNMHCEACAQQLKRKILKMRGVQMAEADSDTSKVIVTGTMDAESLVEYVYRRTKKQARIVPQPPPPEPEPEPEPEKAEEKKDKGEKPAEEAPKEEEKKEENAEDKKEEEKPSEEEKTEEKNEENKAETVKIEQINYEERNTRMMYYYPPMYVIERIPAPQIFSDENPNACCIS